MGAGSFPTFASTGTSIIVRNASAVTASSSVNPRFSLVVIFVKYRARQSDWRDLVCDSGGTMANSVKKPGAWRDPLSLSFEVHRRVLLARLRRHQRRTRP